MIIDFHAHCFPDNIAARATAKLHNDTGLQMFNAGTAEALDTSTRLAGIDLAVIQPIATRPAQTVTINRWALASSSDRLASFGTLHPLYAGWREEIAWLSGNGFRGIKLHPEYQAFFVDDPRCLPIYEAAFAAGLAILFHAGVDVAYSGPWRCPPERMARVIDTFPGAPVVAAHMGGYRFWDDTEKYLLGRDIYLDTSFSLPELGAGRMTAMIRAHGAGKILFGTDSPWTDQRTELEGILSLDLRSDERNLILGGNAAKLLGLNDSSPTEKL